MSKYAKINSDNIVENVIEVTDSQVALFPGTFIKIESRHDLGCGVGIGDEYFSDVDKFKEKQWWDSWTWNEDLWKYVPPIPKPADGKWLWDNNNEQWIEVIPSSAE
jgi:hypothetical protein